MSATISPAGAGSAARLLLGAFAVATLLFMCIPVAVVVPMSFSNAETLQFPPTEWGLRWYEAFFADERWTQALKTSVGVALASSSIALVLGSIAAYGLVRGTFRGRRAMDLNFAIPMVIPHIITAVALYIAFAKLGFLGSLTGLIVGHTVLAAPYVVLVMSVALAGFDRRIEQVAATLGAPRHTILLQVVAPNMLPSLFAAWIFAFIVSFDEITVTVFLAGAHETVPKRMFTQLMERVDPTITAVATLLIAVSLLTALTIALLMRRAGLLNRMRTD